MRLETSKIRAWLAHAVLSLAFLILAMTYPQARAVSSGNVEHDASASSILYVDDDAPPSGDGLSWETAFRYLQDALAVANVPGSGVTEVRVAQGTYKPDQGAGQTSGDQTTSFVVGPGLSLRGGYAGIAHADPDLRNWNAFQTILSGDLRGDDGPIGSFLNYDDNTFRIMYVLGGDNLAIVEGLSILAATGLPESGVPTQVGGGGLYCTTGKIRISNCVFQSNRAQWGGGAFLAGSESEVLGSDFLYNRVAGPTNFGGGLYGAGQVSDCQFIANKGIIAAGGAAAAGGNYADCVFQDNTSDGEGGAVWTAGEIIDCEFVNNFGFEGGAVFGFPTIVNCAFRDNSAQAGGAIRGIATIINSHFTNNRTTAFAGSAFWGGGTVINCEFVANEALNTSAGGAVAVCTPKPGLQLCAPAEVINCVFVANHSFAVGGGAWIQSPQTATFINCTFTQNVSMADNGGAISVNNLSNPPATAIVLNSVAWNDFPAEFHGPIDAKFSCISNGWPGFGNISVDPLFIDSLGPDGIGGTGDEDLRLSAGSPCIDAGDNTALPFDTFDLDGDGNAIESLPIDLESGLRRVNDPATPNTGYPPSAQVIVDMGPYEFVAFPPLPADINHDGVVNVIDLLTVIDAWGPCDVSVESCPADLDLNGVVNRLDLLFLVQHWG